MMIVCCWHKLINESWMPNAEITLSQSRSKAPPVTGTTGVRKLDPDVEETGVLASGVDVVGVDVGTGVVVGVT